MKKITQEELNKVIDLHGKWLRKEEDGKRAILAEFDLSNLNLANVNLSDANLTRAYLRGTNLTCAKLPYALLYGADLACVNLYGADLTDAILAEANLYNAYLCHTNLYCADLYHANLADAVLSNANLSYTNLNLTIGDGRRIKSMQLGKYPIAYTSDVMQIGCKQYPIEEWWSFSDEEIEAMDKGALDWWRKVKPTLQNILAEFPAESS